MQLARKSAIQTYEIDHKARILKLKKVEKETEIRNHQLPEKRLPGEQAKTNFLSALAGLPTSTRGENLVRSGKILQCRFVVDSMPWNANVECKRLAN